MNLIKEMEKMRKMSMSIETKMNVNPFRDREKVISGQEFNQIHAKF